eukprot:gene1158-biopygen6484
MEHYMSTIIRRPSLRAHFALTSLGFRNPNWVPSANSATFLCQSIPVNGKLENGFHGTQLDFALRADISPKSPGSERGKGQQLKAANVWNVVGARQVVSCIEKSQLMGAIREKSIDLEPLGAERSGASGTDPGGAGAPKGCEEGAHVGLRRLWREAANRHLR